MIGERPIRNLPDFVEDVGRQPPYRHPYRLSGVTLLGLVIPASSAKIDAMLDRDLNAPSGGAVDYTSASSDIVMTLTAVKRLASRDKPDSDKGFVAEREIAIWCLAADRMNDRLVWFPPYILPDSDRAVTAGREVYGYPKQVAFFDQQYPDILEATGGDSTIETLAIKCFGLDSPAERQTLCTLHRTPAGYDAPPEQPGGDLNTRVVNHIYDYRELGVKTDRMVRDSPSPSAAITVRRAGPPPGPAPTTPYFKPPLRSMPGGLRRENVDLVAQLAQNPTVVFLKQFRDVRCPGKACYQAVVEAPLAVHHETSVTTFRELPPGLFHLALPHLDSLPIRAELGIPSDDESLVHPNRAFEITDMTFDTLAGSEVWRAPT